MTNCLQKIKILTFLFGVFSWALTANPLEMRVYRVGQANTILVKQGEELIAVDIGSCNLKNAAMNEDIIKLLSDVNNIKIIITHDHKDHYQGVENFIKLVNLVNAMASRAENKIRIHRPISPLPAPRAQAQQGWAPQAQTGVYLYNIQLIPEDLPTTKFAFTPLYSPQVPLAHTASQPNSHSLVLKITQDKTLSSQHANSILLTGDATGPLLEYHRQTNMTFTGAIIGLAVCVLPHHGSASDRSLEWFELIEEQNRGPLYIISSNPKGRDRIPAEYISLKTQTDHVGELS